MHCNKDQHSPTKRRKGRAEAELPPRRPPLASPSLGSSQRAVFIPSSYRTATAQGVSGFQLTSSALSLERLCLSSFRLGDARKEFLLSWMALPPILVCVCVCVCERAKLSDLYQENWGRSISPKEGCTVKSSRDPVNRKIPEVVGRVLFCCPAQRGVQRCAHVRARAHTHTHTSLPTSFSSWHSAAIWHERALTFPGGLIHLLQTAWGPGYLGHVHSSESALLWFINLVYHGPNEKF